MRFPLIHFPSSEVSLLLERLDNLTQLFFTPFCSSPISSWRSFPAGICLLKVNNRNNRTRCKICSELLVKTPERRQNNIRVRIRGYVLVSQKFWRRSDDLIANFKHILHLVSVFLLLTLSRYIRLGYNIVLSNWKFHEVSLA